MNRRELMAAGITIPVLGGVAVIGQAGQRRVAFVLGDLTNVIDVGGPWEVFQDVMSQGHGPAFQLHTVAPTRQPIRMTGGLTVIPQYDFDNAPTADVLVVPAQRGDPRTLAWLKNASAKAEITLSICTGAFQLARAGLLDGLPATTHHDSVDDLARQFPKVRVQRGRRWVDAGTIVTAGGLTSGIDAALHVVHRLVGKEAARHTAAFMEHEGEGWVAG